MLAIIRVSFFGTVRRELVDCTKVLMTGPGILMDKINLITIAFITDSGGTHFNNRQSTFAAGWAPRGRVGPGPYGRRRRINHPRNGRTPSIIARRFGRSAVTDQKSTALVVNITSNRGQLNAMGLLIWTKFNYTRRAQTFRYNCLVNHVDFNFNNVPKLRDLCSTFNHYVYHCN